MITLALFEQMAKDAVAGLTRNKDFFWEEIPGQHDGKPANGAWLVTRADAISSTHKGLNLRTTVDFFVVTENKVKTERILQQIREYITHQQYFCELSGSIGGTDYHYENVRIRPETTPANEGAVNNMIVKMASATLVYDDKNN